jgi:hypothetical protein
VPPDRNGPIRNRVAAIRRSPGEAPRTGGAAAGFDTLFDATVEGTRRAAERLAALSGVAPAGAVERGVRTAYTVINEYLERGREAAGHHRERANWRSHMDDNRYNYGNPNMAWGPMWPLLAPWMQAWACAMSSFPGAAPQGAWGQYAAPSKVSVRVSARHRTEVAACVEPGADMMQLTADPLKILGDLHQPHDEHQAPTLRSVSIDCERGHVRVNVTVPPDQPVGRYSGAIRDANGTQRGELTVDISA